MRTVITLRTIGAISMIVCAAEALMAQPAASTCFTYQGFLKHDGAPLQGPADLEFGLWDAAEGGNLAAGPVTLPAVPVSAGLFSVQLDFGPEAFQNGARWLQIAVEACGSPLTPLSPRQQVTAAPLALGLPGFSVRPTAGSPSLVGGFAGNSVGSAVGATVSGGGAVGDFSLGRCSGNPEMLCACDGDCLPESGTCVADPIVGRCSGDLTTLCDGPEDCAPDKGACGVPSMENRALGDYATVGGGMGNLAGGLQAPPVQGADAALSGLGDYATIAGGYLNEASEWCSTVAGGYANKAKGYASKIAGGYKNEVASKYASIAGGHKNQVADSALTAAEYAAVGGGTLNKISGGAAAAIAGGAENLAEASYTAIAGGYQNLASSKYGSALGGSSNKIKSDTLGVASEAATIAGGNANEAVGAQAAAIAGGCQNQAKKAFVAIGGGRKNVAEAQSAAIAGGEENKAQASHAAVGGGYQNEASGAGSAIPGGARNRAKGTASMAAGQRAKADHDGTFVWADEGTGTDFASTKPGQFLVRAPNGVGIGTAAPAGALHVRGGSLVQWNGGAFEGYGKTSVYTNKGQLDAHGDFVEDLPSSCYRPWMNDNFFFRVEVFVSLDTESTWPHNNKGSGYSMALIAKRRGAGLVHFNQVMADALDATISVTYSSPQPEQLRISVDTNKPSGTPYCVMVKISH